MLLYFFYFFYLKNIYLNNKFVDQGYKTEKLLTALNKLAQSQCFCILIHHYTLCFTGSPCHNVSYHNYISI